MLFETLTYTKRHLAYKIIRNFILFIHDMTYFYVVTFSLYVGNHGCWYNFISAVKKQFTYTTMLLQSQIPRLYKQTVCLS